MVRWVIRDLKSHPLRANDLLIRFAPVEEYRQQTWQTLPIGEELSLRDKRLWKMDRLCGLRLPCKMIYATLIIYADTRHRDEPYATDARSGQ
jgi:hypothetical protein